MDSEIAGIFDDITDEIFGGDFETVSFVSEQNTQVNSVQFVIKLPGVEAKEAKEPEAVPEQKLSFWQKLLRLFKLA